MKTLKLIIIGMMLFLANAVQAQLSVGIQIGTPPPWGPVGYNEARYYYLPDVESYYDVPSSMFIYSERGVWVHRRYLPSRYRGYDLYGGYKVVMPDYRGDAPYNHFNEHKMQYARGYHGEEQRTIHERPGRGNNGRGPGNNGNGHGNNGNGHGNNGNGHGNNGNGHGNNGKDHGGNK